MKVYKAKHAKPEKRVYFKGSEVNETQARMIKSLGGNLTSERDDEWFWRNWS